MSPGRTAPGGGLRARWLRFRNRLIADPAFQRWAASTPLVRGMARRRTGALFDLCGGFIYSQVLHALVELDLFRTLAGDPLDAQTLATRCRLAPDAMDRLIRAAVSLDLVEPVGDGRYTLGQLGAAMAGDPAIGDMVRHHAMLYADLADPLALLRGERTETALGAYWAYAKTDRPDAVGPESVKDYTALMAASQSFIADDVLDAYDFSKHRCLLDVGGGNGTFLVKVAARHPSLALQLFDLPPVAEAARRRFADAGLAERAEARGGSFFEGPLPTGADVVSLIRIVHDHDDADVATLFANIHKALPAGGTLVIAEPMAGDAAEDPVAEAYFGFYLLAMGSGRARPVSMLTAMLERAGFDAVREVPTRRPLLMRLLFCRKS